MAGTDLDPTTSDIQAVFSSALDGGSCLGGTGWYYGLDGNPPPGTLDFATVVLHELGHGLGFQTFVALSTGAKFLGHDDAYERRLEQHGAVPSDYPSMSNAQRITASTSDPNLQWLGGLVNAAGITSLSEGVANGHVRLHGPPAQQPGSSVSHFSTDLFPNQLMEPFYNGPNHDVGMTLLLLRDLGWTEAAAPVVAKVPASSPLGAGALLLGMALAGALALRAQARRRRGGVSSSRASSSPPSAAR
jgi:hypothetical protein